MTRFYILRNVKPRYIANCSTFLRHIIPVQRVGQIGCNKLSDNYADHAHIIDINEWRSRRLWLILGQQQQQQPQQQHQKTTNKSHKNNKNNNNNTNNNNNIDQSAIPPELHVSDAFDGQSVKHVLALHQSMYMGANQININTYTRRRINKLNIYRLGTIMWTC